MRVRMVTGMDALLWLGVICAVIALTFTIWMIAFGAVAARTPRWDSAIQDAARKEAERRGLFSLPLSHNDHQAKQTFVAAKQIEPDPASDRKFTRALAALTDANGEQISALMERRDYLLEEAILFQGRAVHDIVSHTWASRVWLVSSWWNTIVVAVHGLRWFLPLFFRKARGIGERYLAAATLLGVWVGLLWWGGVQVSGMGGQTDWINVVGALITVSTVFGLMTAIISQARRMLVALYGPVGRWGIKYPVLVLVFIGVWVALLYSVFTGNLQGWSLRLSRFTLEWIEKSNLSNWVGVLFVILFLLFLMRNGVRLARSPAVILSERLETAVSTVVLSSTIVLFILFLFDVPEEVIVPVVWAVGLLFVLGGVFIAVIETVKFASRARALRQADIEIPRKGFRLWALISWVVLLFVVSWASSVLPAIVHQRTGEAFAIGASLVLSLLSLALVLSLIPGLVVIVLYIRRIKRLHQRMTAFPGDELV